MIKLEKPFFWSLLVFVFSIPIFPSISTKLLVLLVVLSVFLFEWKFNPGAFLARAWDTILYILVLIAGLFYSMDLSNGLKVLETNFSFIAIPIVFSTIRYFSEKELFKVFSAFTVGLFAACIIYLVNAIILYERHGVTDVFFFYQLTNILGSHPTYLAYYLIFAITYGLYLLFYQKSKVNPYFVSVNILFLFLMLMLTGGQTAFVGLLFVFAFFLLKLFLGQNRIVYQRLAFGLVVGMLLVMVFVSSNESNLREQALNDSWDRFELWRSGILANSNFLFGVGTGDYKNVLNEYYRETHQDAFADGGLNSHNQFIQIFFSNGILGLLAVMLLLLRPLYLAFKHNSQLGILMLFPFLIYGMTEVFLGRYQGVVFFTLLHQVFIKHYLNTNKTLSVTREGYLSRP